MCGLGSMMLMLRDLPGFRRGGGEERINRAPKGVGSTFHCSDALETAKNAKRGNLWFLSNLEKIKKCKPKGGAFGSEKFQVF